MKWRGRRRSQNIEDRRGGAARRRLRMPGGFARGRGHGFRIGRRGLGGGIGFIIFVLIAAYFGVDSGMLFQGGPMDGGLSADAPPQQSERSAQENERAEFVSVVLADTEDTWHALFGEQDQKYREPTLVLFTGAVESACGTASAAVGPFYCPLGQKIYIDLSFYDELRSRFQAPGDFAQAYVIAHEVGHHVQTLLGTSEKVHELRRHLSEAEANALSVRQELQADCYAGVWAHHADQARQILEQGDVEEALNAASAIGDDRLQRESQGHVQPDSFTHGTSAQRVRWFRTGLETGDPGRCDSFAADEL